ncbi:MAG TPA: nicotinate phosphoribosyltransferase [bacterium]|nr:nicotinate phosphoribosyltransferase [bacterium]
MTVREITNLERVRNLKPEPDRLFHSATHEEILAGATTDIYFVRSYELLRHMGLGRTPVVAEIFARRSGVFVGIEDVKQLLNNKKVRLYSLDEGEEFERREVIMRIEGPYDEFGLFETVILGCMASPSGWATAARQCKQAAADSPVFCFGARHLHPAVAPVMERAAIIGGFDGASCILAAKLAGLEPVGTVPHAVILIMGDTVQVAKLYDKVMPPDAPRIVLVDTFLDEAQETMRVAEALGDRLAGVRLDTPGERGGVTVGLVDEVRQRLDQKGFEQVDILVSGGLTPNRITELKAAGAAAFGVGSYVTAAPPIDMTMDLKVVGGVPIAKRGRIPGITDNPKLKRLL